PPPPGPGWMPPGSEQMRPPPQAQPYRTRAEQMPRPPQPPEPLRPAMPSAERPALPAGGAASPDAGPKGGTTVATPTPRPTTTTGRPDTQYDEAELTIYDVIDADSDMAEQITAGVDEAVGAARGCEKLFVRLEELHARVVELRVPGVLEGMVLSL